MNTQEAMKWMQEYLVKHHPEARIAHKSYGRIGYKYSTVATHQQDHRMDLDWYNHRAVLPEEVVIDFDGSAEPLHPRIEHYNIWRTNGPNAGGFHLHSLWNIPKNISDPKLLKTLIVKYMYVTEDPAALSIDLQVLGNHLIRFEGGEYDKQPPGRASRKTLIYETETPYKINKVPQEVWDRYCKEVLKHTLRSLRHAQNIPSQKDTPQSIRYLLSERFKRHNDGGKRALFALASYYRKLPDDELSKLIHNFNRYNLKVPMDERQLKGIIMSVRAHKGRQVGEAYRRELLQSIGALEEAYGKENT